MDLLTSEIYITRLQPDTIFLALHKFIKQYNVHICLDIIVSTLNFLTLYLNNLSKITTRLYVL